MNARNPLNPSAEDEHLPTLTHASADARYQALLESLPDAVVAVDGEGRIVLTNAATETIFGYSRDELLGRSVEILIPERVRLAHARSRLEYTHRPRRRPMDSGLNTMCRRKDGSELPVEIVLSPFVCGEAIVVTAIIRDVSARRQSEEALRRVHEQLEMRIQERTAAFSGEIAERKQMETALRVREERYRLLVEATGVIPWEIDLRTWTPTYIGPQAVKVFGYPLEAWYEGDFWLAHLHPQDRDAASRFYQSRTVLSRDHEYEYRMITAAGDVVWIRDIVSVETDQSGPVLLRGAMVDITMQKRMEETLRADKEEQQKLIDKLREAHNQLLQSEKMASIGQLAAGVAHEINNPVGFVNSNLGTLQTYVRDLLALVAAYEQLEQNSDPGNDGLEPIRTLKQRMDLDYVREDVFHLLAESEEGLTRVKKIVQDLKEFSHVGKADMQLADLHRGLDSTLNIIHNEIKYKADVVKQYGDIPQVECVASQINQVFMNLLVNAAQAIDKHGTITLRTGVRGDLIFVEIADTGAGVPPEHMNKLFDPFFTTKPVGKGTGLGLSLSYGIVNKHGGRIEVESALGKGSIFRVWLPAHQGNRGDG